MFKFCGGCYFCNRDYRGYCQTQSFDFRENYLNEINETIYDEHYISRSKDGEKGFSRKRKLPFAHLIILLTQGLSRSIQRELNSFYQKLRQTDFSIQHVSKGAFTQARAKLKPEAFVELNTVGIKSFYSHAPYLKWRGWRLLAIDGSTAMLPQHESIVREFGVEYFGPAASSPRSIARLSLLYDVLNFTTLDARMEGYNCDERELARKHLAATEPGKDLLLLDRGYPSLSLMFEMQQLGLHYCIRMVDSRWLEVRNMLAQGEKDKKVTFTLRAEDKELLQRYNTTNDTIRCRLVVISLADGSSEVLCTSVIDNAKLPYECFESLYHYRWNIEEGYKLYKSRISLEAFSGKTAWAVRQDFFAKVFMMTTMAVLAFPLEEKLKQEQQQTGRKHRYKINRTNALSMVKEICTTVFRGKLIREALNALDKILRATTEIIRPGRKFERKKTKKKPPSMNYKQL